MSKIEELLAKYNGNLFDAIQFDEWYKAKISRNEIITYVDYMAWVCTTGNHLRIPQETARHFRGSRAERLSLIPRRFGSVSGRY